MAFSAPAQNAELEITDGGSMPPVNPHLRVTEVKLPF